MGYCSTDLKAARSFSRAFPGIAQRSELELLSSGAELAVVAGIPSNRASASLRAMRAGADVLCAKPAATTVDQVDEIADAVATTGRRWWVAFTEHFASRAVTHAYELIAQGRIGAVRHVVGLGPHRLGSNRPAWFWDPQQAGSILVDLASHQVHHAMALLGSDSLTVVAARTTTDQAGVETVGEALVEGGSGSGYFRVDWLTPDGLPTWGDVRLIVTGETGTIEARPTIDIGGRTGTEHLFVTDSHGVERLDCSTHALTWAETLIGDVESRTERLLSTAHCQAVTALCLKLEAVAAQR